MEHQYEHKLESSSVQEMGRVKASGSGATQDIQAYRLQKQVQIMKETQHMSEDFNSRSAKA